jgi:hypothetical protein
MNTEFPICPICEKQVLIPLTAIIGIREAAKVYAHWICIKCGFYLGTGDAHGYNVPQDIKVNIFPEIAAKVREIKQKLIAR